MSVYSFNEDVVDFHPMRKFPEEKQYQRTTMRTISSSEILLQIQNSGQIQPTPVQTESAPCSGLPNAPKASVLFRPSLRHSNSESSLGVSKTRENYLSPKVFLQVRKHQPNIPDYFSKLSDELILAIFRYLPKTSIIRCAKVCRRLNRLSKDETLWKRIDLGAKRLDEKTIHRLLNRGLQIMRLARAEIESECFDFKGSSICRLQYLDLSMLIAFDSTIVRGLLYRCRSLQALSLESCDVDDECCMYISKNQNLKFLNLALSRGLTAMGVTRILHGCTKLLELNLGWSSMDQETVELACTMLPSTLLRLNLSGSRFGSMDDDDVFNMTVRCPRLIELDISDCTDLTSKSLKHIADNLRHLQTLNCSRCYSVEPNAYTTFCKHLKELNILGTIKDESMPVLKRALTNVEINNTYFSTIARPTVGIRRTSIWEQRSRDE